MVVWRESLLDLYHLIGHLRETLLLAVHFIYLLRMMVQKRLLVLELLYVHLLVEADLFRQGLHLAVALTTAGLVVFELGFEGFYTIFERLHGEAFLPLPTFAIIFCHVALLGKFIIFGCHGAGLFLLGGLHVCLVSMPGLLIGRLCSVILVLGCCLGLFPRSHLILLDAARLSFLFL